MATSILWLSLFTFRLVIVGTRSHCSGVLFKRTAPPCTVRTPWWMISIPEFFSSLKPPLKLLLNTSTFTPCRSKYSRSFRRKSPCPRIVIATRTNTNIDTTFFIFYILIFNPRPLDSERPISGAVRPSVPSCIGFHQEASLVVPVVPRSILGDKQGTGIHNP